MTISTELPRLTLSRKLIWAGLFAVTMGYFEASVVEYLRELYYPGGFEFPLHDVSPRLLMVELGRETASILMLLSVAVLTGSNFIDRFACFSFGFGVWDISYYLFLKLFEGWPSSLATTDILFLIPAPWIGPVWAPVLVSVGLIWASVTIWSLLDRGIVLKPTFGEWTLEIVSGLIIIGSFLIGAPAAARKAPLPPFPWYFWLIGMMTGIIIFLRTVRRARSIDSS